MKAAQCLCELWFDIIHDQNTRKGILHGSVGGVNFSHKGHVRFWTTCTILELCSHAFWLSLITALKKLLC